MASTTNLPGKSGTYLEQLFATFLSFKSRKNIWFDTRPIVKCWQERNGGEQLSPQGFAAAAAGYNCANRSTTATSNKPISSFACVRWQLLALARALFHLICQGFVWYEHLTAYHHISCKFLKSTLSWNRPVYIYEELAPDDDHTETLWWYQFLKLLSFVSCNPDPLISGESKSAQQGVVRRKKKAPQVSALAMYSSTAAPWK